MLEHSFLGSFKYTSHRHRISWVWICVFPATIRSETGPNMEQGVPRSNSTSSIEWVQFCSLFMLGYSRKMQIPSKIQGFTRNLHFMRTFKNGNEAKFSPFDRTRRVLSVCIGFSFWCLQCVSRGAVYYKIQDFRMILHFRRTSKHGNGVKSSPFDRTCRILSVCMSFGF